MLRISISGCALLILVALITTGCTGHSFPYFPPLTQTPDTQAQAEPSNKPTDAEIDAMIAEFTEYNARKKAEERAENRTSESLRPSGPGSLGKYKPYGTSSDSENSPEQYREGAAKVIRHFVKVRHAAKQHIDAIYAAASTTGTVNRHALRQALETYNFADRIIHENWSVYKHYGGTANSVYEL